MRPTEPMQPAAPRSRMNGNARPRKRKLPNRQLLVCTLCRERKVKCDRTKPCFACCARGNPNACVFAVNDGSDYEPVHQSYVIRDLRREVEYLKEQLRDACEGETPRTHEEEQKTAARCTGPCLVDSKRLLLGGGQRSCDVSDTVVKTPFISFPSINHHLRLLEQPVAYPFPSLQVGDNTTAALTHLLPPKEDIFTSLEVFNSIGQGLAVPQPPENTRKKDVQSFLSDLERNATKSPDMLALLFAALGLVHHTNVVSKGRKSTKAEVEAAFTLGGCYISASMQALRNASFTSEPTLVAVKTLIILAVDLTSTGRTYNASALFGSTVRLAYSINLHRDPDRLIHQPTPAERQVRRSLWWLMLYSDQHLSHTLGTPLAISSVGDSPPPVSFTSNSLELRIARVVHEFTLCAREISSHGEEMSIKDRICQMAKLETLWESTPDTLRFEVGWSRTKRKLPDWPYEVISAIIFAEIKYMVIVLNNPDRNNSPSLDAFQPLRTDESATARSPPLSPGGSMSGRARMISACTDLLHAFLFLWNCTSTIHVSRPLESRAVTAVMILLTDGKSSGYEVDWHLVDEVYAVFFEMQSSGVSCIAAFAVENISRLSLQIRI